MNQILSFRSPNLVLAGFGAAEKLGPEAKSLPKFATIARCLGEDAEGLPLIEQAYAAAEAVKSILNDMEDGPFPHGS